MRPAIHRRWDHEKPGKLKARREPWEGGKLGKKVWGVNHKIGPPLDGKRVRGAGGGTKNASTVRRPAGA